MQLYLSQISCTQVGTVCCLVTQHFKKTWLGGNRAIRQMCALLARKNIPTSETGIVNWSGVNREAQIDVIVSRFSKALAGEV
jgi:hypothetical protein